MSADNENGAAGEEKAPDRPAENTLSPDQSSLDPQRSPTPIYEDSLAFLRWHSPQGPWHLCALGVEKKAVRAGTFGPGQEQQLLAWLNEVGHGMNVYLTVNPVMGSVTTKPRREDIAAMSFLHVDVDPRAGEDLDAERARILAKLQAFETRPSRIVDSGGGYNAYWRLAAPVPINGDEAAYEQAKLYNLQLELLLGGDSCHNVDRLLRLPGTVNRPDAKKQKKGRVARLARVVETSDRVYAIEQFEKAPVASKRAATTKVTVPAKVERVKDLNELKGISDLCKVVIAQGCDPDDPNKWKSRSEAQFFASCELVRAGVDDATHFAILTDPEWGISASVLDKGSGAERYALRQIERAHAEVESQSATPAGAILIAGGRLAQIVEEAQQRLIGAGEPIYQRGSDLVRPVKLDRDSADEDEVHRKAGSLVIQPLNRHALRLMMARSASWVKLVRGETVPTDPHLELADALLALRPVRFRWLLGVANCPVMRTDGTVAQAEGYDRSTGLLLDFGGVQFPPVPESPSMEEAKAALAKIKRPFRSYPFQGVASASVVYSAMLTTAISRVVPAVPGHVFDASTMGYGKSKLADCVSLVATGTRAAVMSQGKTAEEDEKRIGAALRGGDPLIVVDNIEQPISGDKLCSAITQSTVCMRVLGQSLNVELPARTLFLFTGNNVRVDGDMCRRLLLCRIGGEDERPDKRAFDFDPVKEVEAQRAEMVVAVLTVLRAYVAAGRPRRDLAPIGSFEEWNIVREALVWLGEADPEQTRERVVQDDSEREEMLGLLRVLHEATKGEDFKVALICRLAPKDPALLAALDVQSCTPKRVADRLRTLRDRVLGGLVLRRTREDAKHGHTYQVVSREPAPFAQEPF